jgi:hypothetical protein
MHGDIRDYRGIFAALDSDSDEREQLGVLALHHVGILTHKDSLPALPWEAQGEVIPFQCHCYLWRMQEFVVPYGGPLAHALSLSGTRLHHLAYTVRNLEATSLLLKARGFKFIDDMHTVGIGGMLVNFIVPFSRGVLLELVEPPPKRGPALTSDHLKAMKPEVSPVRMNERGGAADRCEDVEQATGRDCPLRVPDGRATVQRSPNPEFGPTLYGLEDD